MSTTKAIRTDRLVLTPLRVDDATEMVRVLSDDGLYEFTGGQPPTLEQLSARYTAQVVGPDDGDETWHNWIMRAAGSGASIGFVQATVVDDRAVVAWVVGVDFQGRGFATEAARAVGDWLSASGVRRFEAHIHPAHVASQRVAMALDLSFTGEIDDDGEQIWRSALQSE